MKIWSSQILSLVTINLINFVIVLRVFETTHSTVAVSLVWIFYAMPALLIGPFSGTIVDLAEKRKILVFTNLIQGFIVLLYLLVHIKMWPIYSIIFLYSLVNQLYIPAEASTLTIVVPKNLLPVANTVFLFTVYGALLVGFGAAGSLVKALGKDAPFLLSSFLLFVAALVVYRLPAGMKGSKRKINRWIDFWRRVREGYLFIRGHMEVFFPLILLVLANVIVSVLATLAPLFVTEVLAIDLLDIGLVMIFPIGFGAILGALGVVLASKRLRKKQVISFGLFLMALTLLFLGLVLPLVSSGKVPLTIIVSFFFGLGLVSLCIPTQTAIQEKTPPEFRGRVFGVLSFLFTLAAVLPILLTATIADTIGVSWVVFIMAICLGGIGVYSLREPYLKGLNHG